MLNDLFTIARGMTAHGVDLVARHPDVKDMAKGGAIRVRLDAGGRIAGIEIVAEAGRGAVWTLRDGQHNGFPGLKTASGLLLLDADARSAHENIWANDKTTVSRRNELLRLLEAHLLDGVQVSTWPNMGHRSRIAERFKQLATLCDDPLTASIPAAFERFLLALSASPSFVDGLFAGISEHVRTGGDEWLEPARMAFLGPIALMIDVVDTDFQRDAGDLRQIGPISASLGGVTSNADPQAGDDGNCALTGKVAKLHVGNFPQPNLPGLGQTYLFARNRDIPSLIRYGRTADASFAINADLVGRLSGAITALTREETRGGSWRLVPAETGDKPDLLIASLPAVPDARLADFIAAADDFSGESAFFELTSRVLDQSQGVYKHAHAQDEVMVLVLRAVDPANRKTIYQRRAKAVDFFEGAKRWKQATSNTPDWLGFRMPVKGERDLILRKPPYVAPLSIVPLSRTQFANGGRRRVDVIGVTAATAFGMFLHEGDVGRRARTVLRLLVQRHGALLTGLAEARSKGIEHLKNFDPKTELRRDALRSATWLGALLYHLGRKEDYMSDGAFRLGQLLAAVDVVHVGYCADLRGGDVPANLLGNSVLSHAAAQPKRALAILDSRLKPYLAWAKREERIHQKIRDMRTREPRTEEQKKANRLSWAISNGFYCAPRLKLLVDELRTVIPVEKTDDKFKAELLLGYLAGLPPLPKKEGDPLLNDNGGDPTNQNKGEDA